MGSIREGRTCKVCIQLQVKSAEQRQNFYQVGLGSVQEKVEGIA